MMIAVGVLVSLFPTSADAKRKRSRGRGRSYGRGRRGRGGRGRSGFRSYTAKHTGVVKRLEGDVDKFKERHEEIRRIHEAAMNRYRSDHTNY